LIITKHHQGDLDEIKRQFRQDIRDDIALLGDELKSDLRDVILSKELLTAAIAGVSTATVGGLLGAGNKFSSTRRSMLQNHPMA
jgi:hypothetical protein